MNFVIDALGLLGLSMVVLISAYCVWEELRRRKS